MDICDPTEIFRCGHCSKVLGTINDIIEHDLCAKHSCFAYHDNIEIDPESKLVLVKKLPLTIPKEVLISHTAGPSTSTSKPLGETRGGTGGSQMNYQKTPKKKMNQQTVMSLSPMIPSVSPSTIKSTNSRNSASVNEGNQQNSLLWSDDDVKALIEAYVLNKHKFSSPMHNKKSVWEKISSHLKEIGIHKAPTKCDEKWRNLKKTYEKILEAKKKSGNNRVDWVFFNDFHEIYFQDPHYNPISTASSSGVSRVRNGVENAQQLNSMALGKRKRAVSALDLEQSKQKRHDEKMKLKREIFEWFKENHTKK